MERPDANLVLRRARAEEADALAALKLATFRETFVAGFAIPYPPADLVQYERDTYAPAIVAADLAREDATTWVVARGDRLLGYARAGACKLPHPGVTPDAGELHQLYVLGEAQGLGVGRMLLDTALAHLSATRPGAQWLGVWEGNLRAQAVYAARGFREVGSYVFPVGGWEDRDLIFRRDQPPVEPAIPAASHDPEQGG